MTSPLVKAASKANIGRRLVGMRKGLRNAVIVVVVAFLIAFSFSQELVVLLTRPLEQAWRGMSEKEGLGAPTLHFGSLVEPFWTQMSLALWASVIMVSPYFFFQLWKILAPLWERRGKRFSPWPFALFSGSFFIGGALFCYFVVLPMAYDFLLSQAEKNLSLIHKAFGIQYEMGKSIALKPNLMIEPYLSLTVRLILAFGAIFELPILMFFLSWMGVVNHKSLWRFNRWAIVISFAVAAILTPGPDVISQVCMAVPLVVLYNLSIIIAWRVSLRKARAAAQKAPS